MDVYITKITATPATILNAIFLYTEIKEAILLKLPSSNNTKLADTIANQYVKKRNKLCRSGFSY